MVGSGGREHALGWKLAQSPLLEKIYFAPGNAGTSSLGENIDIGSLDIKGLAKFAKTRAVDLTIVGPDDSLAEGIVDYFQAHRLKILGPTKAAARLESSKAFAKNLMVKNNVPTAAFKYFTSYKQAHQYLQSAPLPTVIKASGLALGKGVFICRTRQQAEEALRTLMIDRQFGSAGDEVVIEEYLAGEEISAHAICDGNNFLAFPPSQDYKQIYDDDRGPNTGGMGALVPLPSTDPGLMDQVANLTIKPIIMAMNKVGYPFRGCLYPGLIQVKDQLNVLEYNARFGDPETQVYMRLLNTDLLSVFESCIDGNLDSVQLKWRPGFAVCIVLASGGYPGKYQTDKSITGVSQAEKGPGIIIFHAGTVVKEGQLYSAGGRVLNVTAVGHTLKLALTRAYKAVTKIKFEGMQYRSDIGYRALSRGSQTYV